MAVIGALLLTIVMSTAVAAMTLVAAIERRSASAYSTTVRLRGAAEGAVALTGEELAAPDWTPALAGAGSAHWSVPATAFDTPALTARIRAEAMMGGGHGADTPVWQVFVQTPWEGVTGRTGAIAVVSWVADDWSESDGRAGEDSNGLILVRAVAKERETEAWAEALYSRGANGRLAIRHIRTW
jgi:hypothetical protein